MKAKRTLAFVMSGLMMSTGLVSAVAHASVVSTSSVIEARTAQMNRDQILQLLQRKDAIQALKRMGVDPAQVQARVQHMTATELQAFNDQVKKMEAGGDALTIIVLIGLILVITDMLGITDVFPGIKPIQHK